MCQAPSDEGGCAQSSWGLWDSSDNGSGGSDVETEMYVGDDEQRSVFLAETHADV